MTVTENMISAAKIADSILALTGEAMMADDFETFHHYQHLPQPIETFEGRKLVSTPAQMHRIFRSVRQHHKTIGVTRIEREVTNARYVDETNIEAVYQSYVYCEDRLAQTPYPAYAMIRRIKGAWKVVYCMYAIQDAPPHSQALLNVADEVSAVPVS